MKNNKEIRLEVGELEVRAESDGDELPKLVGYAARYDTETVIAGMFREVLRPGAFSRAVKEKQDVRALVDHDPSRIIARTKSGSLTLTDDKKGLRVKIEPANTSAGRDIVESVKRGDVSGMSFGFIPRKVMWVEGGVVDNQRELDLREIHDLDLFDVSVVTYPAYEETSVEARAEVLQAERDLHIPKRYTEKKGKIAQAVLDCIVN